MEETLWSGFFAAARINGSPADQRSVLVGTKDLAGLVDNEQFREFFCPGVVVREGAVSLLIQIPAIWHDDAFEAGEVAQVGPV